MGNESFFDICTKRTNKIFSVVDTIFPIEISCVIIDYDYEYECCRYVYENGQKCLKPTKEKLCLEHSYEYMFCSGCHNFNHPCFNNKTLCLLNNNHCHTTFSEKISKYMIRKFSTVERKLIYDSRNKNTLLFADICISSRHDKQFIQNYILPYPLPSNIFLCDKCRQASLKELSRAFINNQNIVDMLFSLPYTTKNTLKFYSLLYSHGEYQHWLKFYFSPFSIQHRTDLIHELQVLSKNTDKKGTIIYSYLLSYYICLFSSKKSSQSCCGVSLDRLCCHICSWVDTPRLCYCKHDHPNCIMCAIQRGDSSCIICGNDLDKGLDKAEKIMIQIIRDE